MKATLAVLNELEAQAIVERYAIGGAMAAMFYAEPVVSYDLDIFVVLPVGNGNLLTLTPLYTALQQRGYTPQGEHVLIEGIPVQFLPVYNPLLEEALKQARSVEIEGIPTRVLRAEHLICIALQTGRAKDRDRVRLLLKEGQPDSDLLAEICHRYHLVPPKEEHDS